MAHFLLTPVGSSGDVHPFIGVGRTLRARGHDVTIATAEPFRQACEREGLEFVSTHSQEEFDRLTKEPDLWRPRRGTTVVFKAVASALRDDYAATVALYRPGDTTLVGHALSLATRLVEETHHAPAATLHLAPSIFRSDFQQPIYVPGRDLSGAPRWIKRMLWWFIDRTVIDPPMLGPLNRFRRELGLAPVSRFLKDWIHSPTRVIALFPRWFADPQPDWPSQLRITGFPLFDDPAAPPPTSGLAAFLASGSAPILFTPGSANRAAPKFFAAALAAVRQIGRRALFLTPFREQVPANLGEDAWHESYVPFSRVLPACAAFVHHAGIGTCAQGLAAGVPQMTMPLGFDQPDNTARLIRLGVARSIAPSAFTPARVASDLATLLNDGTVAARSRQWAGEIARARPLEDTCDLLEAIAPGVTRRTA